MAISPLLLQKLLGDPKMFGGVFSPPTSVGGTSLGVEIPRRAYTPPTTNDGDRAGLLPVPRTAYPGGLGDMSRGMFSEYLARSGITPNQQFKPPKMGAYGKPAATPVDTGPVMGGGSSGEGGGMGEGGGTPVDSTPSTPSGGNAPGPGQPGYVGTGTGRNVGGVPSVFGDIARGARNGPGIIGLLGWLAAQAAERNPGISMLDESSVSTPGVYDATPLDSIGVMSMPDIADLASMPDIGTIGDYGGYSGYEGAGIGADSGGEGGGSSDGDGGGTGEGSGEGGGWAKGGKVTKKRLVGPNPKGPDDGYGALNAGELVVPAHRARKLSKQQIAGLLGR